MRDGPERSRPQRMEGWEVDNLRRSVAMAPHTQIGGETLRRLLATADELSHERQELQALLWAAHGATVPKLRRIVGQMRAVLARR